MRLKMEMETKTKMQMRMKTKVPVMKIRFNMEIRPKMERELTKRLTIRFCGRRYEGEDAVQMEMTTKTGVRLMKKMKTKAQMEMRI
jgi:carbon monoxide dehydrogenase subunit G